LNETANVIEGGANIHKYFTFTAGSLVMAFLAHLLLSRYDEESILKIEHLSANDEVIGVTGRSIGLRLFRHSGKSPVLATL